MSRLVVGNVGPATSVQDAGRVGVLRHGLSSAGAMDRFSLAAANALVGQPGPAAAIEIGPFGARFTAADGAVRLSLYGAAREATIDAAAVPLSRSFVLQAGARLALGPARDGVFTYIGIEGGIAGTPVFGSLSVHARAGIGSPIARPLAAGDSLDVPPASERHDLALPPRTPEQGPIRIVLGPQDDYFDPGEIARFLAAEWRIAPESDRMGYRLAGPKIAAARGYNIVSDGIANGQIQIPGSGQPLVLLADRGTTGGYPKIGAIISADLGRFAQSPVGASLRFAALDIRAAQAATRAWRAALDGLPARTWKLSSGAPSSEALLAENLAGGAINALDTDTWSHS
ncbi:MAG: 5-oxoprolinase/urea amidolyase family protein [Alphaproteobacteria bacterium]|nr:5-oxoprolinase/urea amidolyase family protein [Alphaproteobacteria bacterium]